MLSSLREWRWALCWHLSGALLRRLIWRHWQLLRWQTTAGLPPAWCHWKWGEALWGEQLEWAVCRWAAEAGLTGGRWRRAMSVAAKAEARRRVGAGEGAPLVAGAPQEGEVHRMAGWERGRAQGGGRVCHGAIGI